MVCAYRVLSLWCAEMAQWPCGLNSSISGSKEEKTECEK